MADNPYSPPEIKVRGAGSSELQIGDCIKKLGSWEAVYFMLTLAELISGAGQASSIAPGITLLFVGLFAFFLHIQVLLHTRGLFRWLMICISAALLLIDWFGGAPEWLVLFLAIQAVVWLGAMIYSRHAIRRIADLLGLPDALSSIEQEIKSKGENCLRLQALSMTLGKIERFSEAFEVMKRCVTLEPHNAAVHTHLIWLLGKTGNYEEAEAAYKRMVKNVSDPATRLVLESNYCQLLADTGRLSECRERLVAVEDALRTAKRIAPSINAALESAIQNVRSSLEKQSEPENTNDVKDNMSQI